MTKYRKGYQPFSPLSMATEFRFSVDKDKASEVISKHKEGMFEGLEMHILRDCISFTIKYSTTIQRRKYIDTRDIRSYEKECRIKFLQRYSALKKNMRKHDELHIKTTVTFTGRIIVK